jgi:hypothetical protein
LNSGNSFPVKSVLGVDAEGDVALLKVDAPANQVRPLSLDRTSPQEGESVVVIGNPLGLEGSVTNGIVSAVRDIPGFGRIIQITAPISPGSSGSPVVNMRGEVNRRATLQITGGQSVNFAIPSERIAQLDRSIQTDAQQMSLGELVATTGRNKRAKAVEYFRAGLSFLSKDDCQNALPYFQKATNQTAVTARPGRRLDSAMKSWAAMRSVEASRESREHPAVRRIVFQYWPRELLFEAVSRIGTGLPAGNQARSLQRSRRLLCAGADL